MPTETSLSLADLCRVADVTPRTVRYYISQGLLPSPSGGGSSSRYSNGHLDRLRVIRHLQRKHLPLAEIRGQLSGLSDPDVRELVVSLKPELQPEPPSSALEYIRGILTGGDESARTARAIAMPVVTSPAQVPLGHAVRPPLTARESDLEAGPRAAPASIGPTPASFGLPAAQPRAAPPPAAHPPTAQPSTAEPTPAGPHRSQWDRIALTADIELHIRRPLSRIQNRRVERLITIARELLEED